MAHQCAFMRAPASHFKASRNDVRTRAIQRLEVKIWKVPPERSAVIVLERRKVMIVLMMASGSQVYDDGDGRGSRKIKRRKESRVLEALETEGVGLPTSVNYISSPNNPYVKYLVRLRQSAKLRSATASVLVVGAIPLREICESEEADRSLSLVDVLLLREDAGTPVGVTDLSRRIVRVSVAAMSKISGLVSPPEAAGVFKFPSTFIASEQFSDSGSFNAQMQRWCPSPRRILVLDSIQDPGNLGTLTRTAAAFSWDGVFLLPGCCDPFNEKALRAARGASFRVPVSSGEWKHVLEYASLHSLKLYAGDPETGRDSQILFGPHCSCSQSDIGEVSNLPLDFKGGMCLVLGSEGQGLSEEVIRDCFPIGIPMPGNFESLNVAVAGGILMFLLR